MVTLYSFEWIPIRVSNRADSRVTSQQQRLDVTGLSERTTLRALSDEFSILPPLGSVEGTEDEFVAMSVQPDGRVRIWTRVFFYVLIHERFGEGLLGTLNFIPNKSIVKAHQIITVPDLVDHVPKPTE